MLRTSIGLWCSDRAARLIAFSYLRNSEQVTSVASRLKNDSTLSTMRLAAELQKLSPSAGKLLAEQTLKQAGFTAGAAGGELSGGFDLRQLIKWK